MNPGDKGAKRPDSRIEQMAKNARRRRREWKKHPFLKSAALAERTTRAVVRKGRVVSEKAGRAAYSYGVAYGSGRGQSLASWARKRRAWIKRVAGTVEVDTSQVSRVFKPGMSPRRRALYAAARTRRSARSAGKRVTAARHVAGRHLTRAAAELAASDSPGVRQFARPTRAVADRVHPTRYRCPRCGATYRNTSAWMAHTCVQPHGITTTSVWVPDNPHNPTHDLGRNSDRNRSGWSWPRKRNTDRNRNRSDRNTTSGGSTMSNNSGTVSGGHPAQLIGRGGVALAPHAPATDVELIWTLERLSAACQMVGNGGMSFAENLDLMGVDPRVVDPLKAFAQHIAEGAAFPLAAHRMFWALYGHRIEPNQAAGRSVKVNQFFSDQRQGR